MSESKKPKFTNLDYENPLEKYPEDMLSKMTFSFLSQQNYNRSIKKSKERKLKLKFYPSSIGQSDRDIVLGMLGYVGAPQSGEGLMRMENGTSFHNRMEAIFEDMGIMIAPELSLQDEELCISGRSDAIIWNYLRKEDDPDGPVISLYDLSGNLIYEGPENYILLVEFKSIKDNQFHKLTQKSPKPEHEMQLQLYFYLTGISKGIVYYENKNTQKVKEYIIDRNEEKMEQVTSRIRRLLDMARRKEIPPVEYAPTDFAAQFSNYREMTFPNPNPFRFEDLFKTEEELQQEEDVPF